MQENAIYGFLSMSIKLLKDVKPDYMVYCYDQPGPSFRKDIYEEYRNQCKAISNIIADTKDLDEVRFAKYICNMNVDLSPFMINSINIVA